MIWNFFLGDEGLAKLALAEQFCAAHSVDITTCVAVGDSSNDIPIFEATGKGITFAWCSTPVQSAAKVVIPDLSKLPHVFDKCK